MDCGRGAAPWRRWAAPLHGQLVPPRWLRRPRLTAARGAVPGWPPTGPPLRASSWRPPPLRLGLESPQCRVPSSPAMPSPTSCARCSRHAIAAACMRSLGRSRAPHGWPPASQAAALWPAQRRGGSPLHHAAVRRDPPFWNKNASPQASSKTYIARRNAQIQPTRSTTQCRLSFTGTCHS